LLKNTDHNDKGTFSGDLLAICTAPGSNCHADCRDEQDYLYLAIQK